MKPVPSTAIAGCSLGAFRSRICEPPSVPIKSKYKLFCSSRSRAASRGCREIHMNMMNVMNTTAQPIDDVWIPSSCSLCYGTCSILAHRVDGVVVKIEGNPESAVGKGRLCGKGVSGIMTHYDPNRLTRPLRRTNPKKGLNEDPKWKEISWGAELDKICAVLKKVRAEDPRKLVVQGTTTVPATRIPFQTFAAAFGPPNFSVPGGGQ